MNFLKSCLLLFLILLNFPQLLFGQADTLLHIETVEVIAKKIREHSIGGQTTNWETQSLNTSNADNIAELLQTEAGVFIKSYGLNSLATASIRGGSAGHTLVLWNGLPVQSPMLGLLDLSLLPLNSVENISFQKGGNAALWGSGAIGGVLSLNNQVDFSNKIKVASQLSAGSFGAKSAQMQLGLGNSRFQSSTKWFIDHAGNDFYYTPGPDLPTKQQTNARFYQQNFHQDFYWLLKNNQQLSIHYWRQFTDREIPPTNTQSFSQAHQDDQSNRLVIDWKMYGKKSMFQSKLAVFDEKQNYFDDAIGLQSRNTFTTTYAEVDGQWQWQKQHRVYTGITQSYTTAHSDSYLDPPKEFRSAMFASYQFEAAQWQVQTSLRQEFVDGQAVPLVPVLGINYAPEKWFQWKGKVSKNYRLPTLNDRYWKPGGNENLLPEAGWSEELTFQSDIKSERYNFHFAITGFNRKIDNWILWSRQENQSFWSANNITKVWSRGLEHRFSCTFQVKNFQMHFQAAYDYIRSTNQVALSNPNIPKGAQLIYTPEHQGFTKLSVKWKKWSFSYQHQYTGATRGINDDLPSYHTANASLELAFEKNQYSGALFFNINNLMNADYLVIERRPMPGTNFQLGLNFLFNKK